MDAPVDLRALAVAGALVVATAYLLRSRSRAPPPPSAISDVVLRSDDFGADDEIARDFGRSYRGRGLRLLIAVGESLALRELSLNDAAANPVAALAAELGAPSAEVSAVALLRLAAFCSVAPTFSVLTAAGLLPAMQHHRYVLLRTTRVLRILVVGFVGKGPMEQPWLFTIASPNVLVLPEPAGTIASPTLDSLPGLFGPGEITVQYATTPRRAADSTIDDEIAAAAKWWVVQWGVHEL